MINLKINNIDVQVEKGQTVLDACNAIHVKVPTLCHLDLGKLGFVNRDANCRVCMVEDVKKGNLIPACSTYAKEGMEIRTDTMRVVQSRRVNIELLLSNHPKDCLICEKNGECELQQLAMDANITTLRFEGERIPFELDTSSLSIIRDPNKCILCKRCETMCTEVQTVGTLTDVGRGFGTVIGTAFQKPIFETNCTFCGQCISVCPTGALTEKSCITKVYDSLRDKDKVTVVQVAPAVRVALGEAFGMEPGSITTGKMVAALKHIGFDYIFDTNFAADLTTMEEAKEFVERLESNNLPILTSCCPSWVKFIEHNFGDMFHIPSTCKSPHEMFGTVAKTYFAEKIGKDPEDIVVVSIMPCVAKKYESKRPELTLEGDISNVDRVITTRELAEIIKEFSINFAELEEVDFDDPMGESSGAGAIYGASGGVSTSAIRTAYYMITGEDLEEVEFKDLEGLSGLKVAEVDIKGRKIRAAVASGLGNARKLLEDIRHKREHFDIIEIMACPGGCVAGGGQPFIHGDVSIIQKRTDAIQNIDRSKENRLAHHNKSIQKIYDEYLGEVGGKKAHELLHTHLVFREKI